MSTNYTENQSLADAFPVSSQTSDSDKMTFLLLHSLVEQNLDAYRYVEVGSYLGGTLSPHLRSAKCSEILSIDIRIDSMWDERNRVISYEGVTTAQMLEHLAQHHGDVELEKLITSDSDSSILTPTDQSRASELPHTPQNIDFQNRYQLALIDGEHTNPAVFKDFLNVRPCMSTPSIIMFHDSNIIWQGLKNIRTLLDHEQVEHQCYYLPDNVAAVLLGAWPKQVHDQLDGIATDAETFEENARVFIIRQTIRSNLKLASRLVARWGTDLEKIKPGT